MANTTDDIRGAAQDTERLSAGQRRFAEEHDAKPGLSAAACDERLVFLYSREEGRTFRWLVDRRGEPVDFAVLR